MRLLLLLATTVLLAACVHDTDDFNLIPAESGASLTYYIGLEKSGGDDPWDTIQDHYGEGTRHTGKVTKSNGHDDPWDTINDKFGQETVHTGTVKISGLAADPWDTINERYGEGARRAGSKSNHEDPWDTIQTNYGEGTKHTGKVTKTNGDDDPWDTINELYGEGRRRAGSKAEGSKHDDPWDTINDQYGEGTRRAGSKAEGEEYDDPWARIQELFPLESTHREKNNDRFFMGFEKSTAVFVSFDHQEPMGDRARIVEVRGRVLKLEFADGAEQFVIDAPATWSEGVELVTGFLGATSKKDRPFLGVRFWRTVRGGAWAEMPATAEAVETVGWPQDYFASGASLLVSLTGSGATGKSNDPWDTVRESFPVMSSSKDGGGSNDDPWDTIGENFPMESLALEGAKNGGDDDPWDTIRDKFGVDTVHKGKANNENAGQEHGDPWDEILTNFAVESVHTGKKASFQGWPVVRMLFVKVDDRKSDDDPWDKIGELFPTQKNASGILTLKEVRGRVGRFTADNGRSIFAVGVPGGWTPGLVIRGSAYLLDTKKTLPLMGAVVWEVDRDLSLRGCLRRSPGPDRYAAAYGGPKERGETIAEPTLP